jgi:hypothetical protein
MGCRRQALPPCSSRYQHQIGEGKPGIRIVDEMRVGGVAAVSAELRNARSDQTEIEECRGCPRTAVENKRHRPVHGIVGLGYGVGFGDIGGVENLCRARAGLVE